MGRPFLCSMYQREGYVSPCGARTASGGPFFPCGAKPDGCYGGIAAVAAAVLTQRDRAKVPRPRGDETPQTADITKIPSCHTGKSVVHCPLSLHIARDSSHI